MSKSCAFAASDAAEGQEDGATLRGRVPRVRQDRWRKRDHSDMTTYRGTRALAAAALLAAAVTSCANNGSKPTPTPTVAPSSSAPTRGTATPRSESEIASDAASALLRQYFETVDQLRRQPKRPISELGAVAIGSQLAAQKRLIQSQRGNELRQTGSTTIAKLAVQSVNLDNSDPTAGRVPTVQIDVCYDVSGVDVLDKDGKSVVGPNRPETGWVRYSVSNYKWQADPRGGWRVASGADIKQAPCAGS